MPADAAFDGLETEGEVPGFGRRIFRLSARRLFRPGNHVIRLRLMFEDVTEARLLARHRDMLASELARRIATILQIVTSFLSYETRRAAEPCKDGCRAMEARISAVAELHDAISRSASMRPVPIAPYLEGIAASRRSSLLGEQSRIVITTDAEPLRLAPSPRRRSA